MKRSRTFTTLSNVLSFCQFHLREIRTLKLLPKQFFSIEGKLKSQKVSEESSPLNSQLLQVSSVKEEKGLKNDAEVSKNEVKMVMDRLGIVYDDEPDEARDVQQKFGEDELANLFDKDFISMDELKTAFNVFDRNSDGVIDAAELQSVLSGLGLAERSTVEDCAKMINVFDENGDEAIDFKEFVKLMEECCR